MSSSAPAPQLALPVTAPAVVASPLALPGFRWLLAVQAGFGLTYSTFFLLPKVLATTAGADPDRIGAIMASFGLANVLGAPLVARGLGALGPRRAFMLANAAMATAALGFALGAGAGPLAFAWRALQGLAWALAFSAGGILVVALVPAAGLGRGLALYSSAGLATNALAPALAEPALARFGAAPVFAAAALPALVALVAARRLPAGARPASVQDPGAAEGPLPVRLLFVSVVLGLGCAVMFTFHQPVALARGARQVSGFLVAYTAAALVARLVSSRFTDRLGPARVGRAALLYYGAVVAAAAALSPALLLPLGALYGLAHGTFFPVFMVLALQAVAPTQRNRMLSWVNATFNGGGLAVAGLGVVGARLGWTAVFVPAGLLLMLAAFALPWPRRGAITDGSPR